VFRPCLAPCDSCRTFPGGKTRESRWLRRPPKELPRPIPRRATAWNLGESAPRGGSTASVPHPKARGSDVIATHLRRDSFATQCRLRRAAPVVRARAPHPSAVARVPDGETARRTRARPEAWSSARHSRPHALRRALRRGACCVELRIGPSRRTVDRERAGGITRRCALGGSWLRHLQQAGGPARARQSSCSPGQPRLDPKTKPLPRSEDRNDRRRGAVGAVGPHIPPRGGDPSRAPKCRAEVDRSPSRAGPTEVGPASVPSAPKRFGKPRPA
jgi:hypothetical protein